MSKQSTTMIFTWWSFHSKETSPVGVASGLSLEDLAELMPDVASRCCWGCCCCCCCCRKQVLLLLLMLLLMLLMPDVASRCCWGSSLGRWWSRWWYHLHHHHHHEDSEDGYLDDYWCNYFFQSAECSRLRGRRRGRYVHDLSGGTSSLFFSLFLSCSHYINYILLGFS